MSVKQRKTVKPTGDAGGFCAYIGPTIRGVIQHGTIYDGNKQDALKSPALRRSVDAYPEIAGLLVPGYNLMDARSKIKTPGSLLCVRYKALADRVTKEEKL
ncbi:MAG: hypothetical protein ACI3V3_03335 [Faecousia sp.]